MASRYRRGDAVTAAPAERDFSFESPSWSISCQGLLEVTPFLSLRLILQYPYGCWFLANESHTNTGIGSQFFRNRLPKEDASVIQRLQAAGAVLLGKTNMDEFAAGILGRNQFYGDTRNAWNLNHSPGGSSSGTACAIAAGLCLGGIGTDTGGSIRVPASWSGIVGLRPTHGLVSLAGVYPRAASIDVAGPLAGCVDDIAVLLDAIAGYDARDTHSVHHQNQGSYTDDLKKGVSGLRLGLVKNYAFRVEPEVARAIQAAVNTFIELGAKVVPVETWLEFNRAAFSNIVLYEFNQSLGKYRAAAEQDIFGTVCSNLDSGEKISQATYEQAQIIKQLQTVQLKKVFGRVDALLTPTMPIVAPLLTGSIYECRQFMLPFSFTGVPAISIPCGFSADGLPIGLQIIGNHFEETLILRIAAAINPLSR